MGPARFPAVGAQARRRADGILGEVYLTDPPHNHLSVRWPTVPGAFGHEDYTPDQFAHVWELTGFQLPPRRETRVAISLIAALVLLLFTAILAHDSAHYLGYDPVQPAPGDRSAALNDAQALYANYGMQAAEKCAAGADEYIRSVASHRFHWNDSESALEQRFDHFSSTVSSPGVLTLYSDKASVSNGFGVFAPIRVYCSYDTQSREVLSYAAPPAQ